MSQVRLRPKGQITIPADVIRAAKLNSDATMSIAFTNGVITLTPIKVPRDKDDLMSYAGTLAGVWGSSPIEIKASIAEDRASWER